MKTASEQPLYLRIADELRTRLLQLPVGAPFETEQSLTEQYGVARGTIRQALDVLVREGLLLRTQGCGSFRSQPVLSPYRFTLSQELTDSIRKVGMNSGVRNLSVTLVPATPAVADLLHVPHGTKVRKVSRIRWVDGKPFAYCEGFLRTDKVPMVYKRDYDTSLGDIVRNKLQVPIGSRRCDFCAVVADEAIASALDVPVGSPVLEVRILCEDPDGEPLLSDVFFFPASQTLHFDV
jgi:GntR family transcriptional regulator